MPMTEYDSVEEALKDAIGGRENSMLRRVLREHQGNQAVPAGADYITAMKATDGAVCIELSLDDRADRVIFRYDPTEGEYERYGDFPSPGRGENVGIVPSHAISRWVSRYGVSLLLYEHPDAEDADDEETVKSLFENAAPEGGQPTILPEPEP